jgi:hypothetical protein
MVESKDDGNPYGGGKYKHAFIILFVQAMHRMKEQTTIRMGKCEHLSYRSTFEC